MKTTIHFFYRILKDVVNDTLKKYDSKKKSYRYSRTSLTMFSAWVFVLYMAAYDLYKEGFRYDVFITLIGVSLGIKVTDGISNQLNSPKKEEPQTEGC